MRLISRARRPSSSGLRGSGMGRLVREKCDFLVSIPMKGHISSLNASAAAAILLYEAVRRRM